MSIFTRIWLWNMQRKIKRSAKAILALPKDVALERLTRIRWQLCARCDDTPLRDTFLDSINQLEAHIRAS